MMKKLFDGDIKIRNWGGKKKEERQNDCGWTGEKYIQMTHIWSLSTAITSFRVSMLWFAYFMHVCT
jgi:hypothetical protein